MYRLHQGILIVCTGWSSWLGMQAVHELGHVAGAWVSGGVVSRVVLHPLSLSRTELAGNPHPLVVTWSGPVLGVALPLALWAGAARLGLRGGFVLRFFAGFCLIANGAYLGLGWMDRIGDCGELMRHGTPAWLLGVCGAVAVPSGLWTWHRLGGPFGLGSARRPIDAGVARAVLLAAILLTLAGLFVGGG